MKTFYNTEPLRKSTAHFLFHVSGEVPCTKLLVSCSEGDSSTAGKGKGNYLQIEVAHPVSPIMHPDQVSSHLHSPKGKGIHMPENRRIRVVYF